VSDATRDNRVPPPIPSEASLGASQRTSPPDPSIGSSGGAGTPAHELIYQKLREKILYGEFKPGSSVTLQGIADSLQVSLTPIRESVRRLIAERALEFHGNRRISVPQMTYNRLEEINTARLSLEGELVYRAALNVSDAKISLLETIDHNLDIAIGDGDTFSYLKYNFLFHHELYRMQHSEILLPIIESLWLQLGPSLRVVCGRYGTSGLSDQHKKAIQALRTGDPAAVRAAIHEDILQGREIIVEELSL
jgi:DNA-binding GntR family transcriptional regulator